MEELGVIFAAGGNPGKCGKQIGMNSRWRTYAVFLDLVLRSDSESHGESPKVSELRVEQ